MIIQRSDPPRRGGRPSNPSSQPSTPLLCKIKKRRCEASSRRSLPLFFLSHPFLSSQPVTLLRQPFCGSWCTQVSERERGLLGWWSPLRRKTTVLHIIYMRCVLSVWQGGGGFRFRWVIFAHRKGWKFPGHQPRGTGDDYIWFGDLLAL